MQKVKICNSSKNKLILAEAEVADTFFQRFRGLLGKKYLQPESGLIIAPCNSVHTIGMKFPIDVIFVDKENKICYIMRNMKKGKISPIISRAKMVIEFNAGMADRLQLEINDEIQLEQI